MYLQFPNSEYINISKMSLLEKLDISEKIPEVLKNDIKYYHVFRNEETYSETEQSLLFVTSDDKVYAMGDNICGKLGLGHNNRVESPEEVIELSGKRIEQFFVGKYCVLGLSSDGNLYSWGLNSKGVMGRTIRDYNFFKPGIIDLFSDINLDIKQVCFGDTYVLVLMNNGKVFMWGQNFYKGFKNNTKQSDNYVKNYSPKELETITILNIKVTHIACDKSRFFVLSDDKKVYSWGENDTPFLGHDITYSHINYPNIITKLSTLKIIDIKCSSLGVYFLSSKGHIYVCGHSPEYRGPKYPILIETDQKFTQLERINEKTMVCINDKQIVYKLKRKRVIRTEFTSFEEYSVRKRGITYKTFKTDFAPLMASPDKSLSSSMEVISFSGDEFKFLCKICFESEVQSVVIPCGHTICNTCSQTMTTEMCHFCRSPITTVMKLHF